MSDVDEGMRRICRYCTEPFYVTRHWQVFCRNACKRSWHRENDYCFYCGGYYATDRDHVHPVCAREGERAFAGQETVRCCRECNGALGGRPLELEERVSFLVSFYTKKYKLNENSVEWSADEIAELGPRLKHRIKKALAKRKRGEEAVTYLRYLAGYIHDTTW